MNRAQHLTADARLHRIVAAQTYPLLFATISGAHLYGFPSPDSDYDLRGAHVLPIEKVVGLEVVDETVEDSRIIEGLEMDIVSHDVRKFFGLLMKKNGYVLEQLFSPLVVHTTPEHAELKEIAQGCVTKHHSHHQRLRSQSLVSLCSLAPPDRERPASHSRQGWMWLPIRCAGLSTKVIRQARSIRATRSLKRPASGVRVHIRWLSTTNAVQWGGRSAGSCHGSFASRIRRRRSRSFRVSF